MPIIKQAIKRVRQAKVRTARNKKVINEMKSMIKLFLGYINNAETEKAVKVLPEVVRSIDMAKKKNLIHKNNAANKKSRLQKLLTALQSGKLVKKEEVKRPAKAAKPVKKEAVNKEVKKETPKKKAAVKEEKKA